MKENNKNIKLINGNGYSETYWDDGELFSKGIAKNNICIGLWSWYYRDGKLWGKEFYNHNSQKEGIEINNDKKIY